jgi:hypothetical protein
VPSLPLVPSVVELESALLVDSGPTVSVSSPPVLVSSEVTELAVVAVSSVVTSDVAVVSSEVADVVVPVENDVTDVPGPSSVDSSAVVAAVPSSPQAESASNATTTGLDRKAEIMARVSLDLRQSCESCGGSRSSQLTPRPALRADPCSLHSRPARNPRGPAIARSSAPDWASPAMLGDLARARPTLLPRADRRTRLHS